MYIYAYIYIYIYIYKIKISFINKIYTFRMKNLKIILKSEIACDTRIKKNISFTIKNLNNVSNSTKKNYSCKNRSFCRTRNCNRKSSHDRHRAISSDNLGNCGWMRKRRWESLRFSSIWILLPTNFLSRSFSLFELAINTVKWKSNSCSNIEQNSIFSSIPASSFPVSFFLSLSSLIFYIYIYIYTYIYMYICVYIPLDK